MKVEFYVTKESYLLAIKTNLKYGFRKALLICICLTAFFGLMQFYNQISWPTILLHCVYFLPAILIFIYIVSFIQSYKKFRNSIKQLDKNPVRQMYTLLPDGLEVQGSEGTIMFQWPLLKCIYQIPGYIGVVLINRKIYLIPEMAFNNGEDAILFSNTIRQHLSDLKASAIPPSFPQKSYYWGLLGLIPIAGAINGLIMIVSGVSKYRDVKYVLVGALGILSNAIMFAVVIYNLNGGSLTNGKIFRGGFADMSQMQMNSLVKEIEFYKTEHSAYPDSLQQLQIKNEFINIHDPMLNGLKDDIYNYHRIGKKYTLFSSGLDQIPGSADDIYPSLKIDTSKIGLIVK